MSLDNRKLTPNVNDFLSRACDLYGKVQADRFSQDMYSQLIEGEITSPIEDLFFIAINAMASALYVDINPEATIHWKTKEPCLGRGVFIHPQFKIGNYKVDFMLDQNGIGPEDKYSPVVVELDGHDFHDKDKKQRSYEKARDRFLVKNGYKVLHFTGSDVVKDPFAIAHEVLEMLGGTLGIIDDDYDPENPLWIE